jgi:hypothetical protein
MAFGLECDRCGYTETAHAFSHEYPGACHRYVSPDVVELPRSRLRHNNPAAHHTPVTIIPFPRGTRAKASRA